VIGIDFIVTLVERRLLVWRPVAAETRLSRARPNRPSARHRFPSDRAAL
jgi:hypothetical protein